MTASALPGFRSPAAKAAFDRVYNSFAKLWPVPYEERFVATACGRTHVLVSGPVDAPPLILLHGNRGTNLMWATVVGDLAKRYRCYSVQTINDVGRSEITKPIKAKADYVSWLCDVMDGLQLSRARIMGLSYGGFIAALFAVSAPERVEKLVLLCPAGGLENLTPWFFIRAIPALIWKADFVIARYWRWFLCRKELVAHPATQLFVSGWKTWAQEKEFVIPFPFSDDELRNLAVPTAVLIGDHEVIYKKGPRAALERAANLIPNVRAHLISDAGHASTIDNPAEVCARTLEALA